MITCKFDSGAPNFSWPRSFRLTGKYTGKSYKSTYANGDVFSNEIVILPRISIGKYEIRQLLSYAIETGYDDPIPPDGKIIIHPNNVARTIPLLGNSMFREVLVTIDYKKEKFVIRDKSFQPEKHLKSAVRLDFIQPIRPTSTSSDLILDGDVYGVPAKIMFDTGAYPMGITLSEAFVNRLHRIPRLQQELTFLGQEVFGGDFRAPWKIGPVRGNSKMLVLSKTPFFGNVGCDALIGIELLKKYRTTIDYPRRRLFLESY